jgi:integrase
MSQQPQILSPCHSTWTWPLDPTNYDRFPGLYEEERAELDRHLGQVPDKHKQIHSQSKVVLHRLLQPIEDLLDYLQRTRRRRFEIERVFLIEMQRRGTSFWKWDLDEWKESICADRPSFNQRYGWQRNNDNPARPYLPKIAYLLNVQPDTCSLLEILDVQPLARKIFGHEMIDLALQRIVTVLQSWGYQPKILSEFTPCISYLLLKNRSPHLEDLTIEVLETIAQTCTLPSIQRNIVRISHALFDLKIITSKLPDRRGARTLVISGTDGSIDKEWLSWCDRWRKQSTAQRTSGAYYCLLKVGRWLKVHHPDVTSPAQWSYELSVELIATVNDMKIGEWSNAYRQTPRKTDRVGQPLSARSKKQCLSAMRTFLRDCQEWGWIPIRLNPHRALRTPRSIKSLIGPKPRLVDKDLWAKILWAAMNLQSEDLPVTGSDLPAYPLEMVRAIAMVWCFAALRSDEIVRLRVGCIRWQHEDVMVPETGETLPRDAICFLDIPVNKTSTAYTKAVHTLVGKRINEWEQLRPSKQLQEIDGKTSEAVQFLFFYRGQRISSSYINRSLIPVLCRKANIPEKDSRGKITSHRARSTIASMLYNAKQPLDIFQLKEYLGHKHLSSTQSYVEVDQTKLALDVAKAGYLEQNLATIEVLLDQNAVMSGAAARGESWKYYDLGHGLCTNPFWADCAHRMACAKCSFYRPKDSLKDQLIEGKANLVRMLEFITLSEDEQVLVKEGVELHQELIDRLADVPTPDGTTPKELEANRRSERKVIPLKPVQP